MLGEKLMRTEVDKALQEQQHHGEVEPQKPFEFVHVLARRRSVVLTITAMVLVLGTLYFFQRAPVYESIADVLIIKKNPETITNGQTHFTSAEDYVSTHMELIKSPRIITAALEKHNLYETETLKPYPRELLMEEITLRMMKVTRKNKEMGGGSGRSENILSVSFRGPDKEECPRILKAIVAEYELFLKETYESMGSSTAKIVQEAQKELFGKIEKQEEELVNIAKKTPLILFKNREGLTLRQDRAAAIDAKMSELLLHKGNLETNKATLLRAMEQKRPRHDIEAMIIDMRRKADSEMFARSNTIMINYQEQMVPMIADEQRLMQRYGENYAELQDLRKRMSRLRHFFALPSASWDLAGTGAKPSEMSSRDIVKLYMAYLEDELTAIDTAVKFLQKLSDQELVEARETAYYELEQQQKQNDLARTSDLYNTLVKRLKDVDLLSSYGGYDAQVMATPEDGLKVAPKAIIVFPVSLFLGLLLGTGAAFYIERTDTSFKNPLDIRRRLGLSILGHVPVIRVEKSKQKAQELGTKMSPSLCAHFRPKSIESESFRGVRTSLYFSSPGRELRVIQITSPDKGDGKTTLSSNLAISLAQIGKKVLLIDADFRKPRQHSIFATDSSVGFANVLAGSDQLDDAIKASEVDNLWILPCGPIPPNPAELLAQPRFVEMLEALKLKFDIVLVDTPPVLAVTDPAVVAPNVDGIVMTIRISRNGRPHAERAKEILSSVGGRIIGVVVNGLPPDSRGGYGYVREYSYGYYTGYGRGYGYGYGSGYGRGYGYGYGRYGYGRYGKYYNSYYGNDYLKDNDYLQDDSYIKEDEEEQGPERPAVEDNGVNGQDKHSV
jgi:capsular exopolysaccharide synthesis family protein